MKKLLILAIALFFICAATACADTLTLPGSLTVIEEEAFYGDTSLSEVVLPEGLTEIGANAFAESSVSSINLPSTLTSIAEGALPAPGTVTVTAVEGSWAYNWAVEEGYIIVESTSIDSFQYEIIDNECIIKKYIGEDSMVIIPRTINGAVVKRLDDYVFYSDNVAENVILPDTIVSIGDLVFWHSSLKRISIPSSVELIGESPFEGCNQLTQIEVHAENAHYCSSDGVLFDKDMTTLIQYPASKTGSAYIVPASVTKLARYSFSWCKYLKELTFLTPISHYCTSDVFEGSSLTVYYPRHGNNYGEAIEGGTAKELIVYSQSDAGCIIEYVNQFCTKIPDKILDTPVIGIGQRAFCASAMEEITLPDSITNIGFAAFEGCSEMKSIHLNDGLRSIDSYAFSGCTELSTVSIPGSVTDLSGNTFEDCPNLESILVDESNPRFYSMDGVLCIKEESIMGNNGYSYYLLKYPEGRKEASYSCTDIREIYERAFYQCSFLKEAVISGSDYHYLALDIDLNAFENCPLLSKVTVEGCNVSLGYSGGSIDRGVFYNCPNLQYVSFLDSWVDSCNYAPFVECNNPTVTIEPGNEDWCVNHELNYMYALNDPNYDLTVELSQTSPVYGRLVQVHSMVKVWATAQGGTRPFEYNFVMAANGGIPTISGWQIDNTCTFEITDTGTYTCLVVVRDANQKRYQSNTILGFTYGSGRTVSGILREGDGWAANWQVTTYEDDAGNKVNTYLNIYLEGSNASEGSLMLHSMLGNGVVMPWLADEYGFSKEDFTKISITGGTENPFEIISDTFNGYVNVREVNLCNVSNIMSRAFKGCTSLTDVISDNTLTSIWEAAFKDCVNLRYISNDTKVKYIGKEAFMNTSLGGFGFDSAVSIGERAFAYTDISEAFLEGQVTEIGSDAFEGCTDLLIYCYLNSCACQYAIENGIDYVPLNSMEYYLQCSPNKYDNALAIEAAKLAWATYQNSADAEVRRQLTVHLGFDDENIRSNNYNGSLAFTVATKPYLGNGSSNNTDILVVVARGSTNLYELSSDIWMQANQNYGGYAVYDTVNDFRNAIYEYLDEVMDNNKTYKILLTGHSLGGAGVNRLAAELTDIYGSDNVYCYTFGAINSILTDMPVSAGYPNIHNIYNDLDTFSPYQFGGVMKNNAGQKYGKFGHLDVFVADHRSDDDKHKDPIVQVADHINHDMDKYLSAVQSGLVQYSQLRSCR